MGIGKEFWEDVEEGIVELASREFWNGWWKEAKKIVEREIGKEVVDKLELVFEEGRPVIRVKREEERKMREKEYGRVDSSPSVKLRRLRRLNLWDDVVFRRLRV